MSSAKFRGIAALALGSAALAACAHRPVAPDYDFAPPVPVRHSQVPAPAATPDPGNVHSTIMTGSGVTGLAPRAPVPPARGDVTLSFRGADAAVVARTVSDLTGVRITVAPGIANPVSLVTPYPVARREVMRLFEDALHTANLALVSAAGGAYQIVLAPAAAAVAPIAAPGAEIPGYARETIQLQFVSAAELKKLLDPILPGVVTNADTARNVLTVAGTTGQRAAVRDLVRQFDVNWLRGVSFAMFVPQRTDARLIAPELEKLLNAPGAPTNGLVRLIPMENLNGILAISSQPQYLNDVQRFVDVLDREGESTQPRMHVYRVQNGRAADLAKVIITALSGGGTVSSSQPQSVDAIGSGRQIGGGGGTSLFGGGGSAFGSAGSAQGSSSALGGGSSFGGSGSQGGFGGGSQGGSQGGFGGGATASGVTGSSPLNNVPASQRLASAAPGQGPVGGAGQLALPVTITADETNNAILIYGPSREQALVEDALRQLDVPPTQVLIEAAISEVTLTKSLQYGLQTIFNSGRTSSVLSQSQTSTTVPTNPLVGGTSTSSNGSPIPSIVRTFPGFSFLYADSDISAVLNALQGVTKLTVLSDPKLMVLNNEEASLQVGNQVPVSTGTLSTVGSTLGTANSIDYRDTGIILKITPRVNAGGLVLIDLAEEVSQVVASTNGGSAATASPTFSTRRIATSLAIQDGETIALGGLISDQNSRGTSGIPFLSQIPIIGPLLFGNRDDQLNRTELLILLRPRVIRTVDDGRAITEELKRKIQLVRPFKPGQTLP